MRWHLSALLVFLAALAACDDDHEPTDGASTAAAELPLGYVIFHFRMLGDGTGLQDFRAATNNLEIIGLARVQLSLPEQARNLHIDGSIGPGDGGHNLEWGWHFVPGEWALVEVPSEQCDGNAVLVDSAIDYWVNQQGRFCPAISYVAEQVSGLAETTDGLIVRYLRPLSDNELDTAIAKAHEVARGVGIELEYGRPGSTGIHVFRLDQLYPLDAVAELAAALALADANVDFATPDRIMQVQ